MQEARVEVRGDPRVGPDVRAVAEQQALVSRAYEALNGLHRAVNRIDAVREQIEQATKLARGQPHRPSIREAGEELLEKLAEWESQVIQRKRETGQDMIAFPNMLSAQLQF